MALDLLVNVFDEDREVSLWRVQMEPDQQIYEIQLMLAEKRRDLYEDAMFYFNQAARVDAEALVKDVFKSGDTVVAYLGTAAPADVKDKGKDLKKEIDNQSGGKVRIVLKKHFGQKVQKVYVPEERLYSIDFNTWSKTIEVYWAIREIQGETVYKGKMYELDKPDEVHEYRIMADGLYLYKEKDLLRGDEDPKFIAPVKDLEEKFERHFLNPRERTFEFKNSGPEPLRVISGKKTNFVLTSIIPGEKLRIPIKENREGFEFGLIPAESSSQEASAREYNVKMYDSQDPANVTVFNVESSSGVFKASSVSTNGKEQILENTRIKSYKDSDLMGPKYKLEKVLEIFSTLTSTAGTIVSGICQ